ncbi:MAG TPA: transglutaminase-like domain-containing protein [Pyrinomonadaceae bacterium]|jgi:regulator of sirC expression with transglutaminase-like and TPR domain|nr:transglutaminase-like domain-containing protein [Pyrinomonadaceae bacterium]
MTPADKIAAAEVRALFAQEAGRAEEEIGLARAALLIAAEEEPRRVEVARCMARIDELGETARARVLAGHEGGVAALNKFLFEEQGFAGNEANYYDPRNCLLNHVLSSRRGIPITLSIVYLEVARRAGISAEGVGLPGHFIVRAWDEEGGAVLVDPFYGRRIEREECQKRLDTVYDGKVRLTEEHLRAVGARTILARVLSNLKAVYVQAQLYVRALAAVERILLITPDDIDERRDRGMLLAQTGRLHEAVADTQAYLALSPEAPDAESVREQLKKMHLRIALLN